MSKKKKNKPNIASSKHESAELQSLKTPEFGHQLTIRTCPAPEGTDIDDWVRIAPTASQRLRRFATAFIGGSVLALAAFCILMLPDFAFDYAHRGDNFLIFFRNLILAAVSFIGFAAAINTLLRDTVIYVSSKARCLVPARQLTLKSINGAIRIKDMQMVYVPPEGIFKTAQINIQHQGEWMTLAKSQGTFEDIQELKTWLEALKQA